MAKRGGMYSSNKRKKEMQRQKKQEEKIQRRQKSTKDPLESSDETVLVNAESKSAESTTEGTTEEQETDQ